MQLSTHAHRNCLTVLTAILFTFQTGCGSGTSATVDLKNTHIATISGLYAQYQARNRGRFPKNDADFKKYINEQAKGTLDLMGLASADELLTSERDRQPIKVLYGKHGMTPDMIEVIAYEETGNNGLRLVAFRGGGYDEFDQERFDKIKMR
jgi:hypothetical protein